MSPNLHINCLFKHTVGDAEVSIVVELQVHISAILETKREAHKVCVCELRATALLVAR